MLEKSGEKKELLVIENANKTAMADSLKILSAINLKNKYSWAISNVDIDAARDLRLIYMKKYGRCVGQIQDKINWLYKD